MRHAHLWGVREVYEEDAQGERVLAGGKYQWLWQHELSSTEWTELEPQAPFYLFIPQDRNVRIEYEEGWSLVKLLPTNNVGFVSARDSFVTDFSDSELRKRIADFRTKESEISTEEIKFKYSLKDTSSWNVKNARDKVRANRGFK